MRYDTTTNATSLAVALDILPSEEMLEQSVWYWAVELWCNEALKLSYCDFFFNLSSFLQHSPLNSASPLCGLVVQLPFQGAICPVDPLLHDSGD